MLFLLSCNNRYCIFFVSISNSNFLIYLIPIQIILYYFFCFAGTKEIDLIGVVLISFLIRLFFKDLILFKWINYKCYFSVSSYCMAEGFSNLIYLYIVILNNLVNEKRYKKISAIIAIFLNLLNNIIALIYYNRLEKIMEKFADKDKVGKNLNIFKYFITTIGKLFLNIVNAFLVSASFIIPISYYIHKSYSRLFLFIILDILTRIFACRSELTWGKIVFYILTFLVIFSDPFSYYVLIFTFPFYGYFSKIIYCRKNADNFPIFLALLLLSPV